MIAPAARPANAEDLPSGTSQSGTSQPDDRRAPLQGLLETVWQKRFTTFVTVSMEMRMAAEEVCNRHGFGDAVLEVIGAPSAYRRELISDPAFGAWLALAMLATNEVLIGSAADKGALDRVVQDFARLIQRIDERRSLEQSQAIPGTRILVQRFDVDPLIARVTPPSYTFTDDHSQQQRLMASGYSTAFFKDVATEALSRIEGTWPECHGYVAQLVRVLGYLPDADFRSCSASRYYGVVYLAARDDSILDMEESLVHEAGHQLLYTIVDADAIIRDDAERQDYTLPWSGQVRDFYGYFHAFYIYTLLAKYLGRVAAQPPTERRSDDRQRASERMEFIVRGLVVAMSDFKDNERFTSHGRALCRSLEIDIAQLAGRMDAADGNQIASVG